MGNVRKRCHLPYRGKKHRHGKGIRSRNCRLIVESACFASFAVAIVYKRMLVFRRATSEMSGAVRGQGAVL